MFKLKNSTAHYFIYFLFFSLLHTHQLLSEETVTKEIKQVKKNPTVNQYQEKNDAEIKRIDDKIRNEKCKIYNNFLRSLNQGKENLLIERVGVISGWASNTPASYKKITFKTDGKGHIYQNGYLITLNQFLNRIQYTKYKCHKTD